MNLEIKMRCEKQEETTPGSGRLTLTWRGSWWEFDMFQKQTKRLQWMNPDIGGSGEAGEGRE